MLFFLIICLSFFLVCTFARLQVPVERLTGLHLIIIWHMPYYYNPTARWSAWPFLYVLSVHACVPDFSPDIFFFVGTVLSCPLLTVLLKPNLLNVIVYFCIFLHCSQGGRPFLFSIKCDQQTFLLEVPIRKIYLILFENSLCRSLLLFLGV